MKYTGTYSCGHEGSVNIMGDTKDERERRAYAHFAYNNCKECTAKEHAAEYEAAKAKAVDEELPDLTGTEKQIVWATTLRAQAVETINKEITKAESVHHDERIQFLLEYLSEIVEETSSRFWIDNRFDFTSLPFMVAYIDKKKKKRATEGIVKETRKAEYERLAECAVQPKEKKYDGIVDIQITAKKILVKYPKCDEFRSIVKDCGFAWDGDVGCWSMPIRFNIGRPEDRVAEVGNDLLNAGFTVAIEDPEVRKMAVDASFKPRCYRWVFTIPDYLDYLFMEFPKGGDYNKLRQIHGAKWDSGKNALRVPIASMREILDAADMLGFQFSPVAQSVVQKWEEAQRNIPVINPAVPEPVKRVDKLKETLKSDEGIINDLKD